MPRDGSSIYHRPPGTDGIPNTTIASTPYNSYVADVEQDLNLPRPIVAGGTGASDAHTAMVNLGGEIAGQVVTNYDSFPFVAGSFWSAPGATSAPDPSHYFSGICYVNGPTLITLEARLITGSPTVLGQKYVRTKDGTGWSAWFLQAGSSADLDAAYVNVSGDTMSGPLVNPSKGNQFGATGGAGASTAVPKTDANIVLYDAGATNWAGIGTDTAGAMWFKAGFSGTPVPAMWINAADQTVNMGKPQALNPANNVQGTYYFGNSGTKTLNYDGTNFNLTGGNLVLGTAGSYGSLSAGDIGSSRTGAPTTGIVSFGNTGTKYLNYDGTNFSLVGGSLSVSGNFLAGVITSANTSTTGTYFFGNTGTKYLNYDGTNFNLVGGDLYGVSYHASGSTGLTVTGYSAGPTFLTNAVLTNPSGFGVHLQTIFDGTNAFARFNCNTILFDFQSNGAAVKPGGGAWAAPSDARIKNVLGDYGNGLDAVTALRPVRYTYKDNHKDPADTLEQKAMPKAVVAEYVGLIAQEAEVPMPELVTLVSGYIDGSAVTDLRHMDTTPLIFALINACKELKARVEALEAA